MHKQLSLDLTVLIPNVNFFENNLKPDINSIENSVDSDQKSANQDPHCFPNNMQVEMINPIWSREFILVPGPVNRNF